MPTRLNALFIVITIVISSATGSGCSDNSRKPAAEPAADGLKQITPKTSTAPQPLPPPP